MADDPWAAFGGAPQPPQPPTAPTAAAPAAPSTASPPPSAGSDADAWGAFGGAPVAVPPTQPPAAKPGGGIVRNVGAGVLEGDAAAINTLSDPFGNIIGKPFQTAAMFMHDALAPVFGYERFSDADRAALLDDTVPQPGTRLVSALPGANPADVPATTPAEQITRKAVAAGTAAGTLGGVGPGLIAATTAPVGAAAAEVVPPWAAPATELATDAAAGTVASRVVTPIRTVTPPGRQQLVENLQNEGVPLTAGEQTGSKPLLKTEQMLGQVPGSAGPIANDVQAQQQAINSAVASKAGLISDTLEPTVLNQHLDDVGNQIGTLAANNNMPIDAPFAQTLGQIRQALPFMKTDAAQEIQARLTQLNGMITLDANGNPIVAGPAYQSLMSDLNDSIKGSSGTTQTKLLQLKDTLRQQMESGMAPDDAAQWRQLNRWYANGKVIQDAMGAAGAKPAVGDISLPQLRVAINNSMGRDAYAKGYGDLNDLARAGQSVLRQPADSGSPQGILINRLLQGLSTIGAGAGALSHGAEGMVAGAAAPLVGPWVIGQGMRGRIPFTNYSPGQGYLTNQLTKNVDPRIVAAITNEANEEQRRNQMMPGGPIPTITVRPQPQP